MSYSGGELATGYIQYCERGLQVPKNWTKDEKQKAPRKALNKLQAKLDKSGTLTPKEIEKQYAALALLADANVKMMTVDAAVRWAEDFVREHPERRNGVRSCTNATEAPLLLASD